MPNTFYVMLCLEEV